MKKTILILSGMLALNVAHSQVEAGLISKYNFSFGSAFDEAGTNHGSIVGATPVADRFGINNMALNFNGTSDYVIVPHSATNDLNNLNEITISAWIKPTSLGAGLEAIVTKWNGSTSEQYGLWTQGSTNLVGIRVINAIGVADAATYTAGTWYHVAFTFDKITNQHLVYVNGVQTLTFTPGGTYSNSVDYTSLSIGAQVNDFNGGPVSPNRFFDGAIDDIRIYNRVLTSTEVDSLFDAEAPSCDGFAVDIIQNNASTGSDGSIVFNVNGGHAPYTYTVNSGSSTSMTSGTVCGYTFEGGSFTLNAPSPSVFTSVNFASYGSPSGTCGNYLISSCHATNSLVVAEDSIVGRTSATINANNGVFGDPCFGTGKQMYVQASYANNTTIGSLPPSSYTIVVTDSLGCTATATVIVDNLSGTAEFESVQALKMYPNPTNGLLSIEWNGTVQLMNANGQVLAALVANGKHNLNLDTFENGLYFVKATDAKGNHVVKQIIKN